MTKMISLLMGNHKKVMSQTKLIIMSDVDRVSESSFMHENDTTHKDVNTCKKKERLDHTQKTLPTFMVYWTDKKNNVCISCSDKPKFPPGFTSDNNDQEKNVEENIKDTTEHVQSLSNKLNNRCSNRGFSSQRSMNSHSQKSKVVGSILDLIDELVTVGQTMGYNMAVYAPKELNEMRDLWDCLCEFIDKWEGYAFTWAHKSASKMSKLDRYLISEGVLDLFPYLSALCLDLHLSDHRPILLREINYDYGPSPFRFFHSWFAMKGFNSFVETTSKSLNIVEPNGLIRLKKKLQALKIAIKAWSKEANKRSYDRKINIQQNLLEVNKIIDQGKSNDEILIKRITLLKDLQELNNRNAMEISQKAKIRWSIEGDKNSKYFHGIMNKKRSQLAIRRTLANGEWISEPHIVKNEFFTHFKKQFLPIQASSICFDFTFPTPLSSDQVQDLERTVTYEEVKRAVWDCGTNKSPRLDGFSFEFYHKYWTTIDADVFQAVRDFFVNGHFLIGCDRLSFLKSVLTSIPLYHISIFKVPIGVLNHLESIRQNFFYGVDGSDRKLAWIGWNMVLTSKKNGGIGVFSFFAHNHTLLFKMPRGGVEQKNYDLVCSKVTDLVLPNISIRWFWSLEGSQEFSVKSSCILIDNTILPKAEVLFPSRITWLIADIEDKYHGPSDMLHNPP
nr:RNA-directed DNA polymerase, eukaryota [Tanacetum cinerariifolium]